MMHDSHLEDEMGNDDLCKIRICNKRNKRVPVFITSFSQGKLKTNANQPKFECFKKDDDKIGCDAERKLIANNGRLIYIGIPSMPHAKHFVGVRSKTTGKIKLYDSVLFHMKPDVKVDESDICSGTTPKSYLENLNSFTQSFGSKAKKRALDHVLKCKVDPLEDESSALKNFQQLTPVPDNSQQNIDYLPPQNRNASRVEDVFDIDFIISPEEDASLAIEVQNLLTAPVHVLMKRKLSFSAYVSEHFNNVSSTKAKYLLYCDYLIKFKKLKYADIKKRDPVPHIPEPYKNNILNKFTVLSTNEKGKQLRNCPTKMKDKIMSYIFVLALFIDDYKVNINLLLKDLNTNFKKIITIAQALGCHVSSKKIDGLDVKYGELKLPLFVLMPMHTKKARKY